MRKFNNNDRVKEFFIYDPISGELSWKRRKGPAMPGDKPPHRKDGYIQVGFDSKMILGHRIMWFLSYGYWPTTDIDHKDGNPWNNRLDNLREAEHWQNISNQKLHRDSTTGFKGVSKSRQGDRFRARILLDGKELGLGVFDTAEEAHAAYMVAATAARGEYARSV